MAIEQILYSFKASSEVRGPEENSRNLESERPNRFELPSWDKANERNFDNIVGRTIESERPQVNELPSWNSKSEFIRTEHKVEDGLGDIYRRNNDRPSPPIVIYATYEANDDGNISKSEVSIEYYSTYEERIKQTPREDSDRGQWDGERGESKYTPNDEEITQILEKYDSDGVCYEDGIPDFSDVSESTVEIDNMTESRADNFKQCDQKCAEQWNKEARDGKTDWTARDVKEWRQENGYSWHERNDMKTCDLVPTKINDYFGHLGGVSECKKRDMDETKGSDFDE